MKMWKWLSSMMLMLCLSVSQGCVGSTTYISEDNRTVPIEKGEQAPYSGWILTDKAVIDLLDCCEGKLD